MNLLTGSAIQERLDYEEVMSTSDRGDDPIYDAPLKIIGNIQPKTFFNPATQEHENGYKLFTNHGVVIGGKIGDLIILKQLGNNEYKLK